MPCPGEPMKGRSVHCHLNADEGIKHGPTSKEETVSGIFLN